jgi:hypothetical protein
MKDSSREMEFSNHLLVLEITPKKQRPYCGLQPTELDATVRQQKLSKEETDRQPKNNLCFKCSKPGHQSKWHYQKNKKPQSRGKPQRLAASGM